MIIFRGVMNSWARIEYLGDDRQSLPCFTECLLVGSEEPALVELVERNRPDRFDNQLTTEMVDRPKHNRVIYENAELGYADLVFEHRRAAKRFGRHFVADDAPVRVRSVFQNVFEDGQAFAPLGAGVVAS